MSTDEGVTDDAANPLLSSPSSSSLSLSRPLVKDPTASPFSPFSLRLAFFVLGVGTVLPWNSFLSTIDFFTLAFPSLPAGVVISVTYVLPLSLSTVLLVTSSRRQYASDILTGFVAFTLIAVVVPFLAPASPTLSLPTVLPFLLALASVALASAFVQTALYASASLLSHSGCLQHLNAGTGLAGVLVASVRLATLYTFVPPASLSPLTLLDAARPSVYVFFVACAFICLVCVTIVLWLTRTPPWVEAVGHEDASDKRGTIAAALCDVYSAARDVGSPFAAIFLTFTVTITLFPALFTDIRKHSSSPDALSWFVVTEVFLFNVGDWAGKSIPFRLVPPSLSAPNGVLAWAVARLGFFPLVLLAAGGWWSPSDAVLFCLILAFGFSNGLLASAALETGAAMVPLPKRASAGRSLFLGLIGGMAVGSVFGAVFKAAVK